MIRTLHYYLGRELAKATGLALVAFTLVLTVFAIIEPMRKFGLSGDQVLALFGYTVPVMLSLTLPIAALFAATIVYGRFSQDNELMACRASGISTVSLMKPAIVLGGIVTAISLVLGNSVAPKMVELGERAVKANVRDIVYRHLRARNYVTWGTYVIHADAVQPEDDTLYGVVLADTKKPDDVRLAVASTAYVYFDTYLGETYVTIHLINPAATRLSKRTVLRESSQQFEYGPLPNVAREDASWYNWGQLIETYRHPEQNTEIRRSLTKIRRWIGHDILANDIFASISAGKAYDQLADGAVQYVISAPSAECGTKSAVRLLADPPDTTDAQRVELRVVGDGQVRQSISADEAIVRAAWSARTNTSLVSISLYGDVFTRITAGERRTQRTGQWHRGQLPLPKNVVARSDKIDLQDVYTRPDELTSNKFILSNIRYIRTSLIRRLVGKIVAEIHGRVAYGLSCFVLVVLGAVLGMIFKGGQIVSAFTIAMIPGSAVIIMVIMGKEMVSNPDVSTELGLTVIWGGIITLLAATALMFVRLAKR
ncbi:MAG: LptF/LptG family permease [Planctomycetota bacterium]|nr:LptF/LptG family permease [Planctomycetota bacterium]